MRIVCPLFEAILFGRNYGMCSHIFNSFNNIVRIIATVCQYMGSSLPFQQWKSLFVIRFFSSRQNKLHRVSM